jgi:hypothetical protein
VATEASALGASPPNPARTAIQAASAPVAISSGVTSSRSAA